MLALQQFAHALFQVQPAPQQEYTVAGIGVLIVAVTGLAIQLVKYLKKRFAGQAAENGDNS